MPSISHSQIARRARVSRSTVSRALQNHPAIPEKTRLRIQSLARKMGYRPNALVSALMAVRCRASVSSVVPLAALTVWRPTESLAPYPAYQRLLRGAFDRAAELGYRLEEFWIDEPGLTSQRLNQVLISRGIVAVLLAPLPSTHPDIVLEWKHFSVATFAPSAQWPLFHRASHFHFGGMSAALEELHRKGYRRPGVLLSSGVERHVREQWIGGFAAMQSRKMFEPVPPLVLENKVLEKLEAWILRRKPDVILGNDTRIPQWLQELGYSVPGDIAFANLDRPVESGHSGIDQIQEVIGSSAIDLIIAQIHRNERGIPKYSKDMKLGGVWVDGSTA